MILLGWVHKINNKQVLTKLLRTLTIQIEGAEIPILNRHTEKIEIFCHEGGVGDIKQTLKFKGGEYSEG